MLSDLLSFALLSSVSAQKTYGSSSTVWTTCGDLSGHSLECATLTVPMDHFASVPSNATFTIPLLRMMAKDPDARTIMLNRGGPGVGATSFVGSVGGYFNTVVGEKYHILGFDPRGMDDSRPAARCRPPGFHIPNPAKVVGTLSASDDTQADILTNSGDFYANAKNFARSCAEITGEHLPFINTPQTAADMSLILNAIGEEKLNFYGISYGTVLGATFAQMYPHRVGKMVLDGVSSLEYYYGQYKVASTVDADAVFDGYMSQCLVERETCPLADGFSSVEDMKASLTRAIDQLELDPAAVYINATAFGVLRGSDVRSVGILDRLYNASRWPLLARSLAALIKGDILTPYLHFFGAIVPPNPRHTHTEMMAAADEDDASETEYEAFFTVIFGDKSPVDQLTRIKKTRQQIVDEFQPDVGYLAKGDQELYGFFAESWMYPRGHNFTPASSIKTSEPVLILSNSLDPVTPLRFAKDMNKVLEGSSLIELKGMGHSTMSLSSTCISSYLAAYYNNGTLPTTGTQCETDDHIYFPDPDAQQTVQMYSNTKEDKLRLALRKLAGYSTKTLRPRSKRHF